MNLSNLVCINATNGVYQDMSNEIQKHAPIPIFEQVRELLRERIAQGIYKPDQSIPDERSMAKQFGLSRMTVRRAIMDLTAEGLLTRTRGKGTFVRGSFAPRERRGRPPLLGIVAPFGQADVRNSLFCHRILAGIQEASEQAGYSLAFRRVSEPYEAFVANLREDTALKGLILVEMHNPPLQQMLAKLPIPSVLVDSCQPDDAAPVFNEVNHDSTAAVREAVASLVRLGHREIALFMHEARTHLHRMRRAGYEQALRAHGLPVRPERIFEFNPSGETAYALMKTLLRQEQPPTALVCAGGDELTFGALAAVQQQGLQVPRDFSVIGYGDTIVFAVPPLSTIRVPWEALGKTGVQVLLERFKQPTAPLQRIFLPCEYLARGSCETPRTLDLAGSAAR